MWYSLFRLRYPRNSGLRDAFREVVWPILPETPLQLWVQTQTCRARSGPDILARDIIAALGLQMLGPDLVRPVSLETSSQFQTQICPDLRWSGPVHLGHSRNSGLRDARREVVQPVQPEVSSQLWAPRCRAQGNFTIFASGILAILGSTMPRAKVLPTLPEKSSQLWAQRCPGLAISA